MMNANTIFFDSHGNPWEVVPSDHPDAIHFGPRMWAVPVHGPSYAEARAEGRVHQDENGWAWFRPQGDLPPSEML